MLSIWSGPKFCRLGLRSIFIMRTRIYDSLDNENDITNQNPVL